MKRHIAAAALVLAALGAASQVQAQGWDTGRWHGSSNRHYERSDHRGWQRDGRGGESWRQPWRDQRRDQWRDQDRDNWRGSWRDQWRDQWGDGYRDRHWSEPRGGFDEGRYWRPRYRYYDYDCDGYDYDDDSDISLLISLPLQF